MDIVLDNKRIKSIVYELENGNTVTYAFNNGELIDITSCSRKVECGKLKNTLSDREMMEAVKNSEFMDELKKVKEFDFKKELSKATSNETPKEENVLVSKKLIELDKDGTLNKIAKEHNEEIGKKLKESRELHETETQCDLDTCMKSIKAIEQDILKVVRSSDCDDAKKDKFEKLIQEYNSYTKNKTELIDKIWDEGGMVPIYGD